MEEFYRPELVMMNTKRLTGQESKIIFMFESYDQISNYENCTA